MQRHGLLYGEDDERNLVTVTAAIPQRQRFFGWPLIVRGMRLGNGHREARRGFGGREMQQSGFACRRSGENALTVGLSVSPLFLAPFGVGPVDFL